ncbi:hypothetical protein CAAN1_08S05490 [[Candida] anglica]|uniref:Phosphoglycerate mutase n=1 Tax=[Candida] anglica TaxID=148631 RepID=A0ABP0E5H9_9ASCO
MTLSLLIPTQNDYDDAHGDTSQEVVYREKIATLNEQRDATTQKLTHPWKFETVDGFFKQSRPETDDLVFNYATENFGRTMSWPDIVTKLQQLNESANSNECYKLLFLARHGQGYHNLCVEKYGVEQWATKWHNMETDGEIIIGPDPMLTPLGVDQAKENNQVWKQEIDSGAPIPSKFYVSPLQRSCRTLVGTWTGIKPEDKDPHPLVVESLRETLGVNICDKRSPRSVISERFSKHGFVIDDSVTEFDELYTETKRETLSEQSIRVNGFLQRIFDEDWDGSSLDKSKQLEHQFISTTSHAGTIRAFITVVGHRKFTISTGGMIPIVVKATRSLD